MTHQKTLELDSVEQFNNHYGIATRNPYINIVDLSYLGHFQHTPSWYGIHIITCFYDEHIDENQEFVATMKFFAPEQYDPTIVSIDHSIHGWVLAFDDRLAKDTIFENRIRDFAFFNSANTNTIRLKRDEAEIIINCFRSMDIELNNETDYYSARILMSGIAVLLSISLRYYHRHNQDPKYTRQNIIARLNNILDDYLRQPPSHNKELPTVSSIAKQMGITPNYFGDIVRKYTGSSAHDYIRGFLMKEARRILIYSKLNINTIAYNMGFKYPHHFTRVFKQEYGITPIECRAMHKEEHI